MNEHDDKPHVAVHQPDDLAWCITFCSGFGITIGDVVDALSDVPRDAEVWSLVARYYSQDDQVEGQLVPDDTHTEWDVTIQTVPEACDACAAERAADRVIHEAESLLKDDDDG